MNVHGVTICNQSRPCDFVEAFTYHCSEMDERVCFLYSFATNVPRDYCSRVKDKYLRPSSLTYESHKKSRDAVGWESAASSRSSQERANTPEPGVLKTKSET